MSKEKKKKESPATLEAMRKWVDTKFGIGVMQRASESLPNPPRIPVGIFSVDYMIGGGLPLWGVSGFYGPESGGKTTASFNFARMAQNTCYTCLRHVGICECKKPDFRRVFWVDAEGDLDYSWAESIGVDLDRLDVMVPDTAEQATLLMRYAIKAKDCGAVVLDSLAALVPLSEQDEDSAYSQQPGTHARSIGKLVKQFRGELQQEKLHGHKVLALFTNQIRQKIGVMFGNPESYPGGHAAKHNWSLLLRFSNVSLGDAKALKKYQSSSGLTLASKHNVSVRKRKARIFAQAAEYIRATEDIPPLDMKRGQIRDFNTLMLKAEEHNFFYEVVDEEGKSTVNYRFLDIEGIKSKDDLKPLFQSKPEYYYELQRKIFEAEHELFNQAPRFIPVHEDPEVIDGEGSIDVEFHEIGEDAGEFDED